MDRGDNPFVKAVKFNLLEWHFEKGFGICSTETYSVKLAVLVLHSEI